MILAGGLYDPLSYLFGLVFLFGPLLIGLGVPFALLFGSVRLARFGAWWARGAAILLTLAFLVVAVLVALNPPLPGGPDPTITLSLALLVGTVGLALVIVVAARSDGWLNRRLARWRLPIIVASLALGALGMVGYGALNVPLQVMGEVQGVGPNNFETFQILSSLQNQAPMAVSFVAAAVGAIAWRVSSGRLGVAATLLGCAGVGVNLLQLFLHSGD